MTQQLKISLNGCGAQTTLAPMQLFTMFLLHSSGMDANEKFKNILQITSFSYRYRQITC